MRHRIRYRLDNLLSRGTWAVLLWLGAVTLLAVVLSSLLLWVFRVTLAGSATDSVFEDFWQSLLRILDTGTMASDVGWGRRILALVVTLFGVLVAGTLIGFIASGVEQRIEHLQRGRSVVVESDHVVVLGDSERLPVVVNQLVIANARRRGSAIVILADADPAEINQNVRRVVQDRLGTRLVFRSGDPTRRVDLGIAAVHNARAVAVLADGHPNPDARSIKAVLAAGAELDGFERIPIVVELENLENADALVKACGANIHPVVVARVVARTAVAALREQGISQVVDQLLDFRGSDIHLHELADVVGMPFGAIVARFENACPLGVMKANGQVVLNPPSDTTVDAADVLVMLADNEELPTRILHPSVSATSHPAVWSLDSAPEPVSDHVVIIGWNALGRELLTEWARSAAPNSTVNIIYDNRLEPELDVDFARGDGRSVALTPVEGAREINTFADSDTAANTVVLLGYSDAMAIEEADSRTLLNLMTLQRDLADRAGDAPRIIVEVLDADNVELARTTGADDYLVSQSIASRAIAQLIEQPSRRPVFQELYSPDGPSIHLVPFGELGLTGEQSVTEIFAAAYSAGVIAIGWRHSSERGGEVVLNPARSRQVALEPDDQLVVIY